MQCDNSSEIQKIEWETPQLSVIETEVTAQNFFEDGENALRS